LKKGRPSNRTVVFRGFFNENQTDPCSKERTASLSHKDKERLANVLLFSLDSRSGIVNDLVSGSRFGEICWFFPKTREQFRLSGELHVILSPHHASVKSHEIIAPFASSSHFPEVDWENTRQCIWKSLPSQRRQVFEHHSHHAHGPSEKVHQVKEHTAVHRVGSIHESRHVVAGGISL
jgi:hypothetical protein